MRITFRSRVAIFAGIILIVSAPLVYMLQRHLEGMATRYMVQDDIIYVTPGKYLKPLVLGYDVAVADILWLRAVQYLGDKAPSEGTYKWLYPLADTITTLDPLFEIVYHSAGVVLSTYAKPPRLEESVAILKKGVENNPQTWRHPFYLSFVYFFYLGEYETAAKYMSLAAAHPHHPPFTEKLAARLYAEAADPESGIQFLSRVIETSNDEKLKKELEQRLVDLVAERDIIHLENAIKVYEQKTKKRPPALSDLVAAGIVGQLPKEPGGGHYYLDPEGNVKSSRMKERLRIYGKGKK